MMTSVTLTQAIELIKAGKHAEAQKALEPLLEADPHNSPTYPLHPLTNLQ